MFCFFFLKLKINTLLMIRDNQDLQAFMKGIISKRCFFFFKIMYPEGRNFLSRCFIKKVNTIEKIWLCIWGQPFILPWLIVTLGMKCKNESQMWLQECRPMNMYVLNVCYKRFHLSCSLSKDFYRLSCSL